MTYYIRKRRTDRGKSSSVGRFKNWRSRIIKKYENHGEYILLVIEGTTGKVWKRSVVLKLLHVGDWEKKQICNFHENGKRISLRVYIKENDNEGRYTGVLDEVGGLC